MQSSDNTSPLLSHAMKIRAKNGELHKKVAALKHEIPLLEKEITTLTNSRDDLVEQCRTLREKQASNQNDIELGEYQKRFDAHIEEILIYVNSLSWNVSKETHSVPEAPNPPDEPINKVEESPAPPLSDEFNQQLASMENWLLESAVTNIEKQEASSLITDDRHMVNDDADDLYKDLMIFPPVSDEPLSQSQEIEFDENCQDDFIKSIPLDDLEKQPRADKNQRRFALMRQLAEKSNKTVNRKLM